MALEACSSLHARRFLSSNVYGSTAHPGRRFRLELEGASARSRITPAFDRAEDVIIIKLRWSLLGHRSKDRDDARDVIAVQGDRIDWDYVHSWCDQHGTRALLDEVRQSIPPI